MRFSVLRRNGRLLARGAAVVLVCGAAAGCSSSAARFGGLDDMFTASTPKNEGVQAASLAAAPAGDVSRSALEPAPVARSELPAPSPEPAPAPRKLSAGEGVEVQSGDTIYGLARRYGVPPEQIMAANGLDTSSSLKIGQRLVVPGVDVKKVAAAKPPKGEKKQAAAIPAPAEPASPAPQVAAAAPVENSAPKQGRVAGAPPQTLDQQAQAPARTIAAPAQPAPAPAAPPKATAEVLEESQQMAAVAPQNTGIAKMRWPVRGKVVSNFGSAGGKASDGIDIAVPAGTPVKAAENGVVIYAGDGLKEFGNTVLVRHEDGLVTVYGHASELKVARGEKVKRGQEIAASGMTGNADSPKLHFEVRKNSAPVDPKQYLE